MQAPGIEERLALHQHDRLGGAERTGLYVTDVEVARRIIELVAGEGPAVFVFAITMENHGPWTGGNGDVRASALGARDPALHQYLGGLRRADRMIALLADALTDQRSGLLGFYGDHLPSLPTVFDAVGFADTSTDYFVWHPQGREHAHRDIIAHQLPEAILAGLGR
jgi:phosphoglycerol transferase MdoB-like AlkP superfamily enzyme